MDEYLQLFADQLKMVQENPNATRSNKLLIPMHSTIANQVETYGFKTISLRDKKEYTFPGPYGDKNLDIAIFDKDKFVGAIMYKGIRSEYNKNHNNYFENMRGESQLLIDANISVYQIILIPTQCKHKKGEKIIFETPNKQSTENYNSYIRNGYKPEKLKLGVFYIDVDYKNFTASYSTRRVEAIEETTMSEGIKNFCMSLR